MESIAANNVVDGLALQRRWEADGQSIMHELGQAGATTAERELVGVELDALTDALDAVSDALTAEAAYQMVRGNTSRAASTLQAMATGEAPPPELEVTRTPRSGIALTHRVLLLWSGDAAATPGWTGATGSPRAAAEPMLDAWAATLLGDPHQARCTVERMSDTDDTVLETRSFPLGALALAPLDVVFGAPATADGRQGVGLADQPSELEQRVLDHALHMADGFEPGARLRIQHARPDTLAPGERTLLDVLEQARATRHLLAGARAVDADDLTPAERGDAGTLDLDELQARVVTAAAALAAAHDTLDTLVEMGPAADTASLRAALLALAAFGVSSAVPAVAGDDEATRAALLMQATAVLKESKSRVAAGAALAATPSATEPRVRRDQLVERMRAVFGGSFVTLPRFACQHAAELGSALTGSTAAQGGDPLASHTWFARSERVRDAVSRLGDVLRGAEVLATGARLDLSVAQLPFQSGERWVGLPLPSGQSLPAGKLSLVVQLPTALDTALPLTGLLVDEWVEIVPKTPRSRPCAGRRAWISRRRQRLVGDPAQRRRRDRADRPRARIHGPAPAARSDARAGGDADQGLAHLDPYGHAVSRPHPSRRTQAHSALWRHPARGPAPPRSRSIASALRFCVGVDGQSGRVELSGVEAARVRP